MTETSRTVREVIAEVQLHDVRLKESSAKTRVRDLATLKNPAISISHGTKVIHRFDGGFIVGARLTARVDPEDRSNPAAEASIVISVTLALTYLLRDAPAYSEDVLQEFARVNGAFHAWPYWREYVQSTSSRMNLPPMVLPVFHVGPATDGRKVAASKKKPQLPGRAKDRASKTERDKR